MLSQRLMLMLLSSTELTDMLDTHMLDTLMDTHMPMVYGYYGKRSADAEPKADADAALLYGAYGYAGYPYAGYSYGYPYAYGAYGYYGKRSADAEPKADAGLYY